MPRGAECSTSEKKGDVAADFRVANLGDAVDFVVADLGDAVDFVVADLGDVVADVVADVVVLGCRNTNLVLIK
jgi:hypothetical protein